MLSDQEPLEGPDFVDDQMKNLYPFSFLTKKIIKGIGPELMDA